MAKPMSGTLAAVRAGTPPLSASEVEPTKASTLGIRFCTSDALVEAFCWSSSTSRLSLRPQMPPAASTAEKSACTAWGPCGNEPVSGPVIPLTFPNVMEVGVTPVSEAVFPAVPVQSPASDAAAKLKPLEVGDAAAVGAEAAPPAAPPAPAAAPPVAAFVAGCAPGPVPTTEAVPPAPAPPAGAVVDVVAAAPAEAACCEVASPDELAPR